MTFVNQKVEIIVRTWMDVIRFIHGVFAWHDFGLDAAMVLPWPKYGTPLK